jgi:NAD(P)-dependent dehydrogenase (short-subunit alcohol dehydrogenase family)
VLGRDRARLDAVAAATGAEPLVADVTDTGAMTAAFAAAERRSGPVDVLVNNAGIAPSGRFLATDDAVWRRVLETDLMGVVTGCRLALPAMLERGFGRIVSVASTAGLKGYPYVTAYCAAKHAVVGLTRALALETATRGVTVNAVCPGYTDTDLIEGAVATIVTRTGRTTEAAKAELARANPQGRLVRPAEVAAAVLWLVSPGSEAITGQAIAVAGGEVT